MTTFSITTLGITLNKTQYSAQYTIVILSAVLLSIAIKPFMLNVVVMNVVAPFALSLASFAGLSNTW
jgi:hypothetical protein